MNYQINKAFSLNAGFAVNSKDVLEAAQLTNGILDSLPASLYRSLDYKTTSSIIGSVFCEALANECGAIVNPIEKGHPDIVPTAASDATEEQLRNYPMGVEIKTTIGNIEKGANLRAGQTRVSKMTGITWQAHHREVRELMGLTWDFANVHESFRFPAITGVFYSSSLEEDDWGAISGTTGRNTKVSGMLVSGKQKMGSGWILLLDEPAFLAMFQDKLGFKL